MNHPIRTKKISLINPETLLCTLDLGKQRHAAYYRLPDGRDIKPFFIKNNKRGVDSFWRLITQVKKEHKLKKIVLAYESTSCYWEPIIYH